MKKTSRSVINRSADGMKSARSRSSADRFCRKKPNRCAVVPELLFALHSNGKSLFGTERRQISDAREPAIVVEPQPQARPPPHQRVVHTVRPRKTRARAIRTVTDDARPALPRAPNPFTGKSAQSDRTSDGTARLLTFHVRAMEPPPPRWQWRVHCCRGRVCARRSPPPPLPRRRRGQWRPRGCVCSPARPSPRLTTIIVCRPCYARTLFHTCSVRVSAEDDDDGGGAGKGVKRVARVWFDIKLAVAKRLPSIHNV